jgi:tRNA A-37 threonylcarbamoyl transferase component Bud32
MEWKEKLNILKYITRGLYEIHKKGFIHHDFYCGNILNYNEFTFITDLGLC